MSIDVTDRTSSKPGKFDPFRLFESHDVEKIDAPPNALDNPAAVGRVREPDLRRLLRSVTAEVAADEAIEAE